MADRKVTVLNPAGYQEQLPDADNLLLAALPTELNHAVNKQYVDQGLANIDLSDIESDINQLEADLNALTGRVDTLEGKVSTIESDYATKTYVDAADQAIADDLTQEITDRTTGDQNLQDQIDAIIAQGELQTLQDVTDLGSTTTNDITSEGTITAATLVGDLDYGEY